MPLHTDIRPSTRAVRSLGPSTDRQFASISPQALVGVTLFTDSGKVAYGIKLLPRIHFSGLTFTQRPRESTKRAADASLAGRAVVVRLIELQFEGLRVEVDLLLGLLPRQREGGDAVDARYQVPFPETRGPRLASGVHLEVECGKDVGRS